MKKSDKPAFAKRTAKSRCRSCGGRLRMEEEWTDPISRGRFLVWRCETCGVRRTENELRKVAVRNLLGLRAKTLVQGR